MPDALPPDLVFAEPHEDFSLTLVFETGERRRFDMRPYFARGPVFAPLADWAVFQRVAVEHGSLEWPTGAGLSYVTLYLQSTPLAAPVTA